MNYFSIICFVWAAIGIGSRIAMAVLGDRWDKWELENAYKKEKPKLLNVVGIVGYLLVIVTWVMVFTQGVRLSWIIAALITLTVVKVSAMLFNYDAFRKFVDNTLKDKKKMLALNVVVIILAIALVLMGLFLY